MEFAVKENEPLALHTVFRIGGPAEYYIEASSSDALVQAIDYALDKKIPYFLLGAGSNTLIADQGIRGVVIHPTGGGIHIDGAQLSVEAGVSMARVVAASLARGLRGFEWAIGVPGTIGGSVVGNAGCFGSEMKDVLGTVEVYRPLTRAREVWPRERANFGYRDSVFKKDPTLVVLKATLVLRPGDTEEGNALVRTYTTKRLSEQDIGTQSAGCIFKNVSWTRRDIDKTALLARFPIFKVFDSASSIPAGFLVDQMGMKGTAIGGAKVSERHGNFIVNTGRARAEEVIMLIGVIKERVHRAYGILLEEEVRYAGFI